MSDAVHPLLLVQEHDAAIDHLRHEREVLPERGVIADAEQRTAHLQAKRATLHAELAEVAADQKRREDEVASLEAKIARENDKLYGGSITSPKEAQAIQEELEALARHQDHLETELLQVMDRREPLDAEEGELDGVLAELAQTHATATAALATNEAEIDAKVAEAESGRAAAVAAVDEGMLATYEDLRRGFGASTVVAFDGKNCVGCPMIMPAMVLDGMKKAAPGTINPCSECGRLVLK